MEMLTENVTPIN